MGIMTSWRDSASEMAQNDLDGLINATLPFAQQQLEKHGEFFPFGAAVSQAGETKMLAGDPEQGEHPASAEVLSTLLDGVRSERDELRAVAFCSDVRLTDSDAIGVELEHREGPAMAVLLPYTKKRFGRGIEYSALQAGSATNQVWATR